ncbi:hypothetical protein [Nostoc sp.]|uniref:hypothetical protein n=1 Tax=Nostoc sp. TaxID=1180 RepID=UPI002FFCFA37
MRCVSLAYCFIGSVGNRILGICGLRSHPLFHTGDRLIFEVFCKAIACHHTISDRIIFEVFCKAIACNAIIESAIA